MCFVGVWHSFLPVKLKRMPSSVIHRFRYNSSSHTLRVWFVSGKAYDYKKIPEEVYNELITASSKGKFLNEEIKGKYTYEKVN